MSCNHTIFTAPVCSLQDIQVFPEDTSTASTWFSGYPFMAMQNVEEKHIGSSA